MPNDFGSIHAMNVRPSWTKLSRDFIREPFMSQARLPGFLLSAILWFTSSLMAQNAPAAASVSALSAWPIAVIPFELYHNRVYLPVRVNGSRPFTMILDTGAAETFVSEKVAEELKLPRKGSAQVHGNGEGVGRFPLAKNVNFSVGDGALLEKTIVIYNYDDLEKHEGRTIDGTLGVNFFHKYVVQIDYGARKLSVYDPAAFSYSGAGSVIPLRILNGGTVALFDAKIVDADGLPAIDAHLAVDSGTYSALRLFRPFVEKHALIGDGRNQFASIGFGAGGEFRQVTGRVESLEIDGVTILNPVADFSTDTKGVTATTNYDGTIGGDILRRFTVILDYSRQQMILEPNSTFGDPFAFDMSGRTLIG
jgi:aspartyl protease